MPLFRFPILFRANGYEAIMRSHAVLRGFWYDLGLDIADNLFSCDYGGSTYDRGIKFILWVKQDRLNDTGSAILIFSGKGVEKRHTAFSLLS